MNEGHTNITDVGKKFDDFKKFLNITDEIKTSDKLTGDKICTAIQQFKANWFTVDNLAKLLDQMRDCTIYANASDMSSILKLFKDQNKDLYFNSVSKCILKQTAPIDVFYHYNNKFTEFRNLLSYVIENTDAENSDNLEWDDVLNKVNTRDCKDVVQLLQIWNNSDSKKKKEVDILKTLNHISGEKIKADGIAELLSVLTKEQKASQLTNREVIGCILSNKMSDYESARDMSLLAEQLKSYLTKNDTDTILNKTLRAHAEYIYKLVTQLTLEKKHLKTILGKLDKSDYNKSQATDLLKLVDELVKIGFVFDKDHYENVLEYLNNNQTVDDVCALLNKFEEIGVKLTRELVDNVMNKLSSNQTVDDVCALLGRFKKLGILFDAKMIIDIVNKLKSDQTVYDVCNLLDRLKKLGILFEAKMIIDIVNKLESNQTVYDVCALLDGFKKLGILFEAKMIIDIVNKLKSNQMLCNIHELLTKFKEINSQFNCKQNDDVVYAILKKFKSLQSTQSLLSLVKELQSSKIQLTGKLCCNYIVKMLDGDQDASKVADLLIALGNFIGFDKIQNLEICLPGIDDILNKIANNQTQADMLKLAKVLIAMGKNLTLYPRHFREKLKDYDKYIFKVKYNVNDEENQDLETLLKLNPNQNKLEYTQEQQKFVKEFKKSEEKLIPKDIADNNILNKTDYKDGYINQNGSKNLKSPLNLNLNQKECEEKSNLNDDINKSKGKSTIGSSNNKLALQIIGVALAILGILCIILSLTIAFKVLLGLLISGCILFTVGISILVGLFCKHKSDESINLSSGYQASILIDENGNIYEPDQYRIKTEKYYDPTYGNNNNF